ncbi:MAG: serine protease [Solirubrobacterales bacterium]
MSAAKHPSFARRSLRLAVVAALTIVAGAATGGVAQAQAPPEEVAPGVFAISAASGSAASVADLRAIAAVAEAGEPELTASSSASSPKIVGGNATSISKWPWQVAITKNSFFFTGNGSDRHTCGATLIAPNVAVSAAHCFFDVNDTDGTFDDPDLFGAITGRTQLSTSQGPEVDVADYFWFGDDFFQPLYKPEVSDEWDVVLVVLAQNSTSQTIKIAGPSEGAVWEPGRDAYVTGWGTLSAGGSPADTLREVKIGMLSNNVCGAAKSYAGDFFPPTMVCAGKLNGGKDACQGDSGGPLVVPIAGGGYRLVGDTSFGQGCAEAGFPGVYGRIAAEPIQGILATTVLDNFGVNVLGSGAKPPPDTTAPDLRISGPKRQKAGGAIKVKVQCHESCKVTSSGKAIAKGIKSRAASPAKSKALKLKKKRISLSPGSVKTLKLKLKRKGDRKTLKRASKGTAKIKLAATDSSGNKRKAKRAIKLR